MITLPSIEMPCADVVLRALEIYELDRLVFAEAYLAALTEATGVGRISSFDQWIDRLTTVEPSPLRPCSLRVPNSANLSVLQRS